ncbi:beta-ribofuranosylaminobenzene 5'-phosphate synthase family protein [Tundrisphaera sp. TA3]|uniref:beta-ribofuranosylaminobenzene 5'-phosphate synthase family protein n=1 Tax=Tundrisphaera sp. TA3 TaxID=3435775 RepID=UPI003EC11A5E
MTRLTLHAPSRLHFGLLAWGPDAPRQFGGVGLMVAEPGLELVATPAPAWSSSGPLSGRILETAARVSGLLQARGMEAPPLDLAVRGVAREHVGLGLGTQVGLGVARLICRAAGWADPPAEELARLAGRGLRSGIGLHGFAQGGLIVDGGRRSSEGIPPLLARLEFPADWLVLLVVPRHAAGLHGEGERRAFADLPPFPESLTDRLCRLVLLGMLPAVVERDLDAFGAALDELQRRVGEGFAPAQGGIYARPEAAPILDHLRAEGLRGVGQSSWGPTLYGFADAPSEADRAAILARLRDRFRLAADEAFWTHASTRGAEVADEPPPQPA